jgi:hypothetical protein
MNTQPMEVQSHYEKGNRYTSSPDYVSAMEGAGEFINLSRNKEGARDNYRRSSVVGRQNGGHNTA